LAAAQLVSGMLPCVRVMYPGPYVFTEGGGSDGVKIAVIVLAVIGLIVTIVWLIFEYTNVAPKISDWLVRHIYVLVIGAVAGWLIGKFIGDIIAASRR